MNTDSLNIAKALVRDVLEIVGKEPTLNTSQAAAFLDDPEYTKYNLRTNPNHIRDLGRKQGEKGRYHFKIENLVHVKLNKINKKHGNT